MSRIGATMTLCLALAGACGAAESLGSLTEVSIIDRDTGAALTPHFYRGEYWVAGRPGAKYAIEVHNRLGERVLAVTSVDGVNVLSGATAAFDQTGYVFEGGQRYQITGWRKSDAEVAAFTFTDLPDSYAARTGRPANVGVIGIAVFRERRPVAIYKPAPRYSEAPSSRASNGARSAGLDSLSVGSGHADSAINSLQAPASPPPSAPGDHELAEIRPAPERKLGTGHGERESSYVTYTAFDRQQPEPNEVIRIRYDSMENLVAMGVMKRPRPLPPTMNPFPGSPEHEYVPDPPG
jgi:hypothetical protein